MAGLMANQYKQWSPQALQALWNIFQTGETPAELSQKRGMESDFQKYAQQLYGGVTGDALSRGLGNSSIFASNIFGAGRTAANMLAQGRAGLLQSQEARRMQALQALFGGIGAQAGTAMTGLTNQQNQWQQGQAGMSDALAQLWYQIGQRNKPTQTAVDYSKGWGGYDWDQMLRERLGGINSETGPIFRRNNPVDIYAP